MGRWCRDLHEGCGPLGGIEAALRSSKYDWNLILPVGFAFFTDFFIWTIGFGRCCTNLLVTLNCLCFRSTLLHTQRY